MHALHDLFPGIPDDAFTLHRELKLNGGNASVDDVVSFEFNGSMAVGQLKMAVGVHCSGTDASLFALVALWEHLSVDADGTLQNFRVRDTCVKVLASTLDTVFTHRFSKGGDTCAIILPYELQRRS